MPRTSPGIPLEWIRKNSTHSGSECLIWPFARRSDGYANLCSGPAYRVMCELAYGPPPTSRHQAAHSCGNGKLGCINPCHLGWKTHTENAADKIAHNTVAAGERHGASKLTKNKVAEIRTACKSGVSQAQMARRFGVAYQTIWDVVHGKTWEVV